ncbi:MAG: nucleotidyltransferase domain-containing protein [Trueperaceae bacterium]
MNLGRPHAALLSETMGSLLTVLAKITQPVSGRELERLSGVKHASAQRALRRLDEHGLVTVDEAGAGAALLYSLNREHISSDAVLILTTLRRRLVERLTSELSAWPVPPKHASMFGSAARGDGGTSSDIDLFIVRSPGVDEEAEEWREQLALLGRQVLTWTGNHAGIVEVSAEELKQLGVQRQEVVQNLERDGINLYGPLFRELLKS